MKLILEKVLKSPSLLAAGMLVVLNLVLTMFNPLSSYDPEKLPAAHSWIFWAAQDFCAQPRRSDVVLLGSSLLVNPICAQEANFLQKDVDNVVAHRCHYLEWRLKQQDPSGKPEIYKPQNEKPENDKLENDKLQNDKLQKDPMACFNFAVPGSLMSDNYMILRSLLNGARTPKVVVLGLALRDFIDNEVPCAAATPVFRYLERYTNVSDIAYLAMPEFWQRQEFWLKQHIYLVGKKLDLQTALSQFADTRLRPKLEFTYSPCRLNDFDMSCYVPSLRSDVERNVWISKPNVVQPSQDNSPEYKRRYRTPNAKLFECQKIFLEKFLAEADARGIKVLMVNLPVTREHMALMPPGAYAQYQQTLSAAQVRFHSAFLDLNADQTFCRSDFMDTCHMRASGGKKLLDRIAQEAHKSKELAKSLEISGDSCQFAAAGSTIY